MKPPDFISGVAVALTASLGAVMASHILGWAGLAAWTAPLLTTTLTLAYIIFLLRGAPLRIGHICILALWALATGLSLGLGASIHTQILMQVGFIWSVRVLYYYTGFLPALADFALCALSLGAALWALDRSASLFLALWSLFLVQALFVFIPSSTQHPPLAVANPLNGTDRFEQAYHAAQRALQRLSSVR